MAPHPTREAPIVCGVDFSDESTRALRFAADLAARLDRPLTVVTVIDPLLAEAATSGHGNGRFEADALRDLEALASASAGALDGRPPRLTASVETGAPAAALHDVAAREDAWAIAVGTQGLGRAKRLLLGSTTLRLLRRADRPILAVPAGETGSPDVDHVLWATDFGRVAEAAGRVADGLAGELAVPLTVVHAVEPVVVPAQWDAVVARIADRRKAEADGRLTGLVGSLHAAATAHVRVGPVLEVLAEAAGQGRPLIVMGLESHDGHRPGSLAYRVLTHLRAPVLAVP